MRLEKLLRNIFWLGCFICTICISVSLIFKYVGNESSSVLRVIKFNRSDDRNYPALTLCFLSDEEKRGLYKDDYIGQIDGMNTTYYRNALLGIEINNASTKLSEIDFNKATINISDIVADIRLKDINGFKTYDFSQTFNSALRLANVPLEISYQDPERICCTYHPSYTPDKNAEEVDLFLNTEKLGDISEGHIHFFAHYKHQFIRNMRYINKVTDFPDIAKAKRPNLIIFDWDHISIIQMREDANDPCSNNIQNDDYEWLANTMNIIGCIPPYWEVLIRNHTTFNPYKRTLSICSTSEELRNAARYLPYQNEMKHRAFDDYTPPCTRMRVITNTNFDRYKDRKRFKIKLRYRYAQNMKGHLNLTYFE